MPVQFPKGLVLAILHQYVAVVVDCELGVEDRSFAKLLKVEAGGQLYSTVRDSGYDKCC